MEYLNDTVQTEAGLVEFWRVENTIHGVPRYVIHFMALPFEGDDLQAHYRNTARLIFGQKYRAKWYGGGVVFQSFNPAADIRAAVGRALRGE